MIQSFANELAEDLFEGSTGSRKFPSELKRVAQRKLQFLNEAHSLGDLMVPPGNRLEPLKGDRKGFYSIRINSQRRVVFRWEKGSAWDVSVADYH